MRIKRIFVMLVALVVIISISILSYAITIKEDITNLEKTNEIIISNDTKSKFTREQIEEYIKNNYNNKASIQTKAATPEGFLDRADGDRVEGWAWRRDVPNEPIDVHSYVYKEGTDYVWGPTAVNANIYRKDLENAGIGNGKHGFSIKMLCADAESGKYRVIVYAIGENGTYNPSLTNCPKYFDVVDPTGSLDVVNGKEISGWAWRASSPNEPIDVNIYLKNLSTGQEYVKRFTAGYYREDLKNAGIGNGEHKFSYAIDWESFPTGYYEVRVKAIAANNEYDLTNNPKYYINSKSAFVAGTNTPFSHPHLPQLNTETQAENTKNIYNSCGYNTSKVIDPDKNTLKNGLLSKVVFISCHGNWNHIQFKNQGFGLGKENVNPVTKVNFIGLEDISRNNWKSNVKLISYIACYSAANSQENKKPEDSLTYKTAERGAEIALGFTNEINSFEAIDWTKKYNEKLRDGYTVIDAARYASSGTYIHGGIKDYYVVYRSDSDLKITYTNTRANNSQINTIPIEKNLKDIQNIDNTVSEIIKKQYSEFDLKNYEIKKHNAVIENISNNSKDEIEYIDYILKIGDFITDAGYTVEITNGKISALYDNNIDLKKQIEEINNVERFKVDNLEIKNKLKDEANIQIKEKYSDNQNVNIDDNELIYYYDIKEDKKYLIVNVRTSMENNGQKSYALDSVKYEI